MRNKRLAIFAGLMSGVWAGLLTALFFGFIPTLPVVFVSGFVSGVLGIATVLLAERLLKGIRKV